MRLDIDEKRLEALDARQREVATAAIEELAYLREADPLAFYFPHAKQKVFHSFRAAVVCFFGGNQSGKTTCGLADDLIQAIDWEACPEHLKPYKHYDPPFLCRIMAPSFSVLENTLYTKLQELLPKGQIVGESWSKAFDKNLYVLHFKNGSKFFFQTYEMDPAKMGGATLDRVHYDEEPPERARNECRIRVMRRGGQELFTMTPVEGLTWTFDALWEKRGEPIGEDVWQGENLQVVTVDMDDNPTLTAEAKEIALGGMSNEERRARKQGHFVALHGRVYEDFRPDKHVCPEVERPPKGVNIVVGIDPGIRNKAAVVWTWIDAEDQMVVFEEGYYSEMTVREVAAEIHKTNARYEIKPIYYVIDPAARNKEHQTGRSDQMEYADHGVLTIAGQNAVTAGINRIRERFQTDRLEIGANCVNLIRELGKYRWKDPPRSGEDPQQKPVKKDDHLLDALRYAVMSRPYLPEIERVSHETELERWMREDQQSNGQDGDLGPSGIYV